jgi:hypothetical protein
MPGFAFPRRMHCRNFAYALHAIIHLDKSVLFLKTMQSIVVAGGAMGENGESVRKRPGKQKGAANRSLTPDEQARLGVLRTRLRAALEHERANGGDASLFEALGDIRTVERWAGISRGSERHKFRPHNITQIEKFLTLVERKTHYQYLARELGQKRHNFLAIQQYEGDYCFFRYRPEGTLTIKFDAVRGEASFQQFSGNYDRDRHSQRPEHNGYVFLKRGKLFFAGRREGVMRLGIVNLPEGDDPQRWFMAGLVMSIADEDEVPFSAKVLLVPEKNTTLLARLSVEGATPSAEKAAESNFLNGVRARDKDVAFLRLTFNKPFLSEN